NADVVVRNNQGDEIARTPTISALEVISYACIADNTPFIIGGLVAKDDQRDHDRVPVLGDITVLGKLVSNTRKTQSKAEVIIVLTPYVLPEERIAKRNLPKDKDTYDNVGMELFRDAYRIRGEDVFDLSFLRFHPKVREMQRLANTAVRENHQLRSQYPYNRF